MTKRSEADQASAAEIKAKADELWELVDHKVNPAIDDLESLLQSTGAKVVASYKLFQDVLIVWQPHNDGWRLTFTYGVAMDPQHAFDELLRNAPFHIRAAALKHKNGIISSVAAAVTSEVDALKKVLP